MRANTTKKHVMYDVEEARRTLDPHYMGPYLTQAQWAEFTKLKEIIGETYNAAGKRPLWVLDIGVGLARIPVWLSHVATWDKIAKYVGIDISPDIIEESKKITRKERIANKVEVILFDATDLSTSPPEVLKKKKVLRENKYDLVICTYFTAGDFKPPEIKLQIQENGRIADYDINTLRPNEDFISVFRGAYNLLQKKGKIVIGSIYWDNDAARKIQENFYKRCGMTVITSSKDPFTATRERFWSERFDQHKIYSYLSWTPLNKIELIPLDDYKFAFMVVIHK